MVDICDFAVGLSRQLYGRSIASERPGHRLTETWHPLGPVAVITAFNFPVAVWSWNAALALVCGDPVIWKPSERTPLTAMATLSLFERAAERFGGVPEGLADAYRSVSIGDPREAGTLVGPLVTGEAYGRMEVALDRATADGGDVVVGGGRIHADRCRTPGTRSRRSCGCRRRPTSCARRR